jgi:hypothetical protein
VNPYHIDRTEMCNKEGRRPHVTKNTRQLAVPSDINDPSCNICICWSFVSYAIKEMCTKLTYISAVLNHFNLLRSTVGAAPTLVCC